MNDIWKNQVFLDGLEKRRAELRATKRLTFDCFHAKVRGDWVFCDKGKMLTEGKKEVFLPTVLCGWTSKSCQKCEYFTSMV